MREALRRKARGFWLCLGFGTCYGTLAGGLFGAALGFLEGLTGHDGSLMPAIIGYFALSGTLLGLPGGLLSGVIGGAMGGRLGWGFAGAAGGSLATLPFAAAALGPSGPAWGPVAAALPVMIGGLLGVGVANGVTRRRSLLPGVAAFAQRLERAGALPPCPGEPLPAGRADLLPAAAPVARGDEGTPALEGRDG